MREWGFHETLLDLFAVRKSFGMIESRGISLTMKFICLCEEPELDLPFLHAWCY